MLNFPRVVSSRYGVAIATVAIAYLITRGLWPLMEPHSFSLFFAAVTFSASQGGLGPGLLATALATILSLFLSRPVEHAFLLGFNDVLRLSVFVLVSLLISSLSVQLRIARQRAETNAVALQSQQAALQNVEERYSLLMNNIRDYALFMLDPNGRVVSWNAGAEEILGYQANEILGQFGSIFFVPEDIQKGAPQKEMQLASSTGRAVNERWHVRQNGEWFWGSGITAAVRDPSGQLRGFAKIMRDLTQHKQAEEERARLLNEAETANRVKDEFLAVLSHELRSPLNPILGWTKMLRSRPMESAMRDRALEVIERNAKLQAQLVEDLLDISRILRGKLSLNVISVNLAAIVGAALETVRLSAEAKSIQIQAQLEQETAKVMGDPSRLQQVIWNLLSNAVKFTPQGGQIKVKLEFVEQPDPRQPASTSTSTLDLPTYAQLTISDTGQGISAKFLPHIFDYFRQADSSTTRNFGGLGLGLAIARQIVEQHGGTIQGDSAGIGQGATFTVRLPAQKTESKCQDNEHEFRQDGASSTPKAAQAVLQDLRVLAVDDDDDTREFLGILLEQHGAVVATAASTFEALECLEHYQPDVLLSDIGMPEQDGYAFIRQVRSRSPQNGGNIPAIALTAYARESDRLKAIAAGFQTHLAKPIDPAELVAALTNLVQRNGS